MDSGQKKRIFGKLLAALINYPIIFFMTTQISNDHLRLWVGIPVACLAPIWILMGIFVTGYPLHSSYMPLKL
jgi:hypothetical protein